MFKKGERRSTDTEKNEEGEPCASSGGGAGHPVEVPVEQVHEAQEGVQVGGQLATQGLVSQDPLQLGNLRTCLAFHRFSSEDDGVDGRDRGDGRGHRDYLP